MDVQDTRCRCHACRKDPNHCPLCNAAEGEVVCESCDRARNAEITTLREKLAAAERERDELKAGRVAHYREVIREGEDLIARAEAAEKRAEEAVEALEALDVLMDFGDPIDTHIPGDAIVISASEALAQAHSKAHAVLDRARSLLARPGGEEKEAETEWCGCQSCSGGDETDRDDCIYATTPGEKEVRDA